MLSGRRRYVWSICFEEAAFVKALLAQCCGYHHVSKSTPTQT